MSKPPIQVVTASISQRAGAAMSPRTAIQAPPGPAAMARPRKMWHSQVKRLVYE
jgi:hypothetical protein